VTGSLKMPDTKIGLQDVKMQDIVTGQVLRVCLNRKCI